ncbi:MAG: CDP-alcohol phosphatidyltransferase family protein, partial [Anaerolineales bacterium]
RGVLGRFPLPMRHERASRRLGAQCPGPCRGRTGAEAEPRTLYGPGEGVGTVEAPVSDRVLTVPNLISAARLALVPIFVWALLHGKDVAAFTLLVVVGTTDWVDGFVARRTGQVSVLGKLLDPLADRVAIVAALLAFTFRGTGDIPWPLTAVILLRELIVAIVFPLLEARGMPRIPVNRPGKTATAALFVGMGFLAAVLIVPASISSTVRVAALGLLVIGATLYWVAAGFYAVEVRRLLRGRGSDRRAQEGVQPTGGSPR